MLNWLFSHKARENTSAASDGPAPSYEEAKEIAASGKDKEREKLAKRRDIAPEFLYYFATDESPSVRRVIANNDSTPLQADKILARDPDDGVRVDLAHKISRLLPALTVEENEKVTDMVFEVLETLAEDQLVTVRGVISTEIKKLDNVPKRVVLTLAHDVEEAVCAPVLEFSPLLKDEDLLDIITKGIKSGALQAVAKREKVSDPVCHAVVQTNDRSAIGALLKNQTAGISEKSMTAIVSQAADCEDLHAPLVERKDLPETVVMDLAEFVSKKLVDRLLETNPLRKDVADKLLQSVEERVAEAVSEEPHWSEVSDENEETKSSVNATEEAILKAVRERDLGFAARALTIRSSLAEEKVAEMLNSSDPKKLVTLAWKADLSPAASVLLQEDMGITDENVLRSKTDGSYALSTSERLAILYDE